MISRRQALLAGAAAAAALLPGRVRAAPPPVVRVGVLPFGTVAWEAETIRRSGLDEAAGYRLEPVRLATNDAARIAFLGGQVDVIVSDLLLAARLRNEGRKVRFVPYSTTEGAVMVPADSPIREVGDLAGKRIGVAGGALDKNWLLLKAHARERAGIDLAAAAPAYGAPPLIANKLESGELDAALLYWNFCARLEARGYRRLIGAGDIARAFGLKGEIALIGYMFDEALAARGPALVDGFVSSSRAAKRLLAGSEAAWGPVRPLMEAEDEATFQTLRRYFVEGVPQRPVAAEREDAETLFGILAQLGGERLVGPGTGLPPGLYWGDPRDPA
jgi:NitT/TauT family transport system substrate-binding protein